MAEPRRVFMPKKPITYVDVCHGGDNGIEGRYLLRFEAFGVEVESVFWDRGATFAATGEHLLIGRRRFRHEGWAGASNWARSTYRAKRSVAVAILNYLMMHKLQGEHTYRVDSANDERHFRRWEKRIPYRLKEAPHA